MRHIDEIDMLRDPWAVKEYLDNRQTVGLKNISEEDLLQNDLTIFATQKGDEYDTREERY